MSAAVAASRRARRDAEAPSARGRASAGAPPPASNFLRTIIAEDNRTGKYGGRVVTRFPPEPNGYLHYGHAKSIMPELRPRRGERRRLPPALRRHQSAQGGRRVRGFDRRRGALARASTGARTATTPPTTSTSCTRFAEWFIEQGLAYVDSQTADEMRALARHADRARHATARYRDRSVAENLDLFRRMSAGEFPDGAHVLRLKIDMASPNINLRDPAIYRIRHATHHRTGDKWCIYPLYDYTHCISRRARAHHAFDLHARVPGPPPALRLGDRASSPTAACSQRPLPQQYEFARLNLTYVVLSQAQADRARREAARRRLGRSAHADAGRRAPARLHARGLPPVRRAHRRVEVRLVDRHERARGLHARRPQRSAPQRRIAVLDPVKLVIDNYPGGQSEECFAPNHPQQPELGKRALPFSRELWIERDDFTEHAAQGLFPPVAGRRGAAALRLHRQVRRRREGRGRQRHRRALHVRPATRAAARPAPTRARSRATSTGCRPRTRCRPKCASTTGCSPCRFPGARNPWGDARRDAPRPPRAGARAGGRRRRRRCRARTAERNYLDDLNPRLQARDHARTSSRRSPRPRPRSAFQFERHGYFVADLARSRARPAGVQSRGDAAGFLARKSLAGFACASAAAPALDASGSSRCTIGAGALRCASRSHSREASS